MSGIAGIIRFDERSVDFHEIATIKRLLQHRGEVKSHLLKQEQGVLLAFGGILESDSAAAIYATADADIFSSTQTEGSFIANYSQNGPSSFNEWNADFALALWDVNQQMLICARDALGVKPLYYVHQPGVLFAFATEIKALLALQEVAICPNRHKFIEYLTWPTNYVHYNAETFYETIYNVLPGHFLQVTAHQVSVQAYWLPDLAKFSKLRGTGAYSDLFNQYFTEAIHARMQGKSRVGAHLSGGLDSSSVSCVAQSLLRQQNRPALHTFNIDTGLASTDESAYVQSVLRHCYPEHHRVDPEPDVLDSILKINRLFDRPEHFIIPSSFHLSVSIKARQIGCDSILTGHDGDSVIPTGFDYLEQLIAKEEWDNLQLACQQVVSYRDRHLLYVNDKWPSLSDQAKFEKYVLYVVGSEVVKRLKGQRIDSMLHTLRVQKQALGLSSTAIVAYCVKRIKDKIVHKTLVDNAFRADFKQQTVPKLSISTQALTTIPSLRSFPVSQIINTTNVSCNEQLNHIGAYYGHQYSFPFFDKQVVELGLATPLEVSFDHGRGRGLIRNGLQATLPAAITNRLTKANFVEYGNISSQQLYQSTHELYAMPEHAIWEIIDHAIFVKIVEFVFNPRIPLQKKTRYNWLLSRIIYLALWLSSLSKK